MPAVIAIGTSSGGPRALMNLVSRLPRGFPAAFLVVAHLDPHERSYLPEILGRRSPLRVVPAEDSQTIAAGTVYVCVPDCHLLLAGDHIRLTRGPRENHSRPAVDPLFRSCALSLGSRAIGVVLTGALDDGTAGLWAIKDVHGQSIVQLPEEAEYPSMPQSALDYVAIDYTVRLGEMPSVFLKAVEESERRARGEAVVSDKLKTETQIAQGLDAVGGDLAQLGPPTELTCPACGGVLAHIEDGPIVRFRCHTGHAYSVQSLEQQTDEKIEDLLWRALRAIEERTVILQKRVATAKASTSGEQLPRLQQEIRENLERRSLIRQLLVDGDQPEDHAHVEHAANPKRSTR